MGTTVGMGLGDREHVACVLDDGGDVVGRVAVANSPDSVTKSLDEFPDAGSVTVAIETGTHSPWMSDLLESRGFRVLVGKSRSLRAIWDTEFKDDGRGAELLARMARFDPKILSPIRHRGRRAQADLAMIRARDSLVRARSSLASSVRGMLKSFGGRIADCSVEALRSKAEKHIPEDLRPALAPLLSSIRSLTVQIRAFDKSIETMCGKKYPETERLAQVAGVGLLTALAFVLVLENPRRFRESRDVGPYLGLVPGRDRSGQADKPLPITKAGDTLLRRLMVGSANYILGPFGPDCDLRRYGERIAGSGGKVAKRKAKIAVARKLGVLLHRLWVTGETYEPLRNSSSNRKSAKAA
jgi:transposase